VISVYLPASFTSEGKEAEEEVSIEELQGHGERVLLVEDEQMLRERSGLFFGPHEINCPQASSSPLLFPGSLHHVTTVNVNRFPGYEIGSVRGQVYHRCCNLFWLSEPSQRYI